MDALTAYIESVMDAPFAWGTNDCLTFANGAVAVQRGTGFADEYLGTYSGPRGAFSSFQRFLAATGFASVAEALDTRLSRLDTILPPKGSVVARETEGNVFGCGLGVAVTHRAVFVSPDGLVFDEVRPDDIFWGVL